MPNQLTQRLRDKDQPESEVRLPPLRVAGHNLQLFVEAPPLIEAMVKDIRAARQRVWLETYIYLADDAGRAIGEALKARARVGVDVRLVYDAVGSATTPPSFFADLQNAGVQTHAYHTLGEAIRRFSPLRVYNRRDHRKLLIVDDRVAYFGGMNVVDQSDINTMADVKRKHLATSAGWRDLHARLEGPQQKEVAAAFEHLWRQLKGQAGRPDLPWPLNELNDKNEGIYFFDSRPGLRFRHPSRVFQRLIDKAEQSVTISMAYFIPVGRVLRALYRARQRGVRVRVIVPGETDARLPKWASRHLYERLLRRDIELFERQGQILHSKALVIDDQWSVVGSCNFDPRSFRLNLEFSAVIRSQAIAAAVHQVCESEIAHSRRITLEDCRKRNIAERLLYRFAYSFRNWL